MNGIKRFDVLGDFDGGYLDEAVGGRVVLYTDHERDTQALRDSLQAADAACFLSIVESKKLKAENERYIRYGCGTCDGSGHLHRADGEYFGGCTSCRAYELEQAKTESAALLDGMTRIMRATRLGDPAFAIACEVVGELGAGDSQDLDCLFSPGSGNKARRRAESLGIDYSAALQAKS